MVTPGDFAPTEEHVASIITRWGWRVQPWGQATITPAIREVLIRRENGHRHMADLLIARSAVASCNHCGRPHDDLVAQVDPKSATRHEATGKVTLEARAWSTLRHESTLGIPGVFIWEPYIGCLDREMRWIPALSLDADCMWPGPITRNGSGDSYYLAFEASLRPIQTLRCWDGHS